MPEAKEKSRKIRYGYRAKCQMDGWLGELAKSEKEAKKTYLSHALGQHFEIIQVPVKHRIVMEALPDETR